MSSGSMPFSRSAARRKIPNSSDELRVVDVRRNCTLRRSFSNTPAVDLAVADIEPQNHASRSFNPSANGPAAGFDRTASASKSRAVISWWPNIPRLRRD